jgi:hypothetical protein
VKKRPIKLTDYFCRAALGALIAEIKNSIYFENKEEMIKYAGLVNQYRNSFAHDLLKKDSVEAIKKDFDKFMEHFNKMYETFGDTEETLYGARDHLLEKIKYFIKYPGEFLDMHNYLLTEILDGNNLEYISEEQFEAESNVT